MSNKETSTVDEYGFGKLDTWLIDTYLRHKDETLEEAKLRIASENNKNNAVFLRKVSSTPKTETKL